MARPTTPRHRHLGYLTLSPALLEMDNADDRAAAIVAGSIVENYLAVVIMSRLRPMSAEEQKDLFDRDIAPLGSFHAKILMGSALNLYGERVVNDLRIIKNVRNLFAHDLTIRSFTHLDIGKLCGKLFGPKYEAWSRKRPIATNHRSAFLDTANHLATRFQIDAKAKAVPPESNAKAYESAPADL